MRYDLWYLFGPVSWPVWAWIAAVASHWFAHRTIGSKTAGWAKLSRRCWFWGGLWGAVMVASPLGHVIVRPLEDQYTAPLSLAKVNGIFMLTGAERLELSTTHRQPVLSEAAERLTLAVMLHHKFPDVPLVAVGGVAEPSTLRDTDVAYSVFVRSGVPRNRIFLINGTTDTCSNALAARRFARSGNGWLLVTSAAHMPRAMACFKASGMTPIPYPVDFRGRKNIWQPLFMPGGTSNLSAFDLASHEWAGLLYYRLTGRIASIFGNHGN
jgi:uncharacterized SAM-binding protein YcdF (DUF218 family)